MEILKKNLNNFVVEYCENLAPEVTVRNKAPSPIEFLTNYVMPSTPFTIRPKQDAEPVFRAVTLWSDKKYLKTMMGTAKVTVNVAPQGQKYPIVNDRFMVPEERSMDYSDFLSILNPLRCCYVQKQNNLIEEFSPLVPDVKTDLPWMTEAFGSAPVAANIWIGDKDSCSPMHKNNYENIYYVIVGCQRFEIYPPIASSWMPYKKYKKYQWSCTEDKMCLKREWSMKDLNEEINWIPNSRQPETLDKLIMYTNAKSYCVTVHAGEALYIPSLWFYDFQQSEFSIAVNYSYNMKYHVKLPLFRLYEELCKLPLPHSDAAVDTQSEIEESLRLELMKADLKKHNITPF